MDHPPDLSLNFHGYLRELLRRPHTGKAVVRYPLQRRASIKDIIEALGIPHTEVGRIVGCQQEYTFGHIPAGGQRLEVHPQSASIPVTSPSVLRPNPLAALAFMVDINVGKLARLMRMAGFDTSDVADAASKTIVRTAVAQQRILLSRNRELLKHSLLEFGHLVREEEPTAQFREIMALYDLAPLLCPFSRCLLCNGLLSPVAKKDIMDRLLPLTRKYYFAFKQCNGCSRLYWQGSHHQRMLTTMGRLSA